MPARINVELIRHGMTPGNRESRYIGAGSDEDLSGEGIASAMSHCVQQAKADIYLLSPMRRCLETALLLEGVTGEALREMMAGEESGKALHQALGEVLAGSVWCIVPDLRECDFGDFEGYNWKELSGNPAYQAWIDSGGTSAFPHGEDRASFIGRTVQAFYEAVRRTDAVHSEKQELTIRVIAHGGTIMALMDALAQPKSGDRERTYYDWHVPNCGMVRSEMAVSEDGQIKLIPEEIVL